MSATTLADCRIVALPRIERAQGSITPVEAERDVPFPIARVYYFYDVPGGEGRGGHAHRLLEQIIVAVMGAFEVALDDGAERRVYRLERAYQGLYVAPMIWREMQEFSSGGIGVVLASHTYDEDDYIRDYEQFRTEKVMN